MSDTVIVRKSAIDKEGVFAGRKIEKDEVVLKWHPKPITNDELESLAEDEKHYVNRIDGSLYLMQPPERYVNHSCEPNTFTRNFCDIALRNINANEEITSDYSGSAMVPFLCHCGSKTCRGHIP